MNSSKENEVQENVESTQEMQKEEKFGVREFDKYMWFRYYEALNAETPVDKVKDEPYYLKLTESEKAGYTKALATLKKERESYPWAAYDIPYKYLD